MGPWEVEDVWSSLCLDVFLKQTVVLLPLFKLYTEILYRIYVCIAYIRINKQLAYVSDFIIKAYAAKTS